MGFTRASSLGFSKTSFNKCCVFTNTCYFREKLKLLFQANGNYVTYTLTLTPSIAMVFLPVIIDDIGCVTSFRLPEITIVILLNNIIFCENAQYLLKLVMISCWV